MATGRYLLGWVTHPRHDNLTVTGWWQRPIKAGKDCSKGKDLSDPPSLNSPKTVTSCDRNLLSSCPDHEYSLQLSTMKIIAVSSSTRTCRQSHTANSPNPPTCTSRCSPPGSTHRSDSTRRRSSRSCRARRTSSSRCESSSSPGRWSGPSSCPSRKGET